MDTGNPMPDDEQFHRIVAGLEAELAPAAPAARGGPGTPPAAEQSPQRPQPPARPELVAPVRPEPPRLGRCEDLARWASIAGYAVSVGVGAFGQIMFFGTWLAGMLPAPGNWIAAVLGAAFAEIAMIGAGNSSLVKRRDGGSWRLLLAVASLVCAGAVTMQVAHWLPSGFGIALVFGLGSFIGFLIHMVIEHSKLHDHEHALATYETELAAYRAERQRRYAEDLAAYEQVSNQTSDRPVGQSEPTGSAEPPVAPASETDSTPARPSRRRATPKPETRSPKSAAAPAAGQLDPAEVRAWAQAQGAGADRTRRHFAQLGYAVPSERTLRRWINHTDDTE